MKRKKNINLIVGTNNPGKLREIKDLLPKNVAIYSPKDFKLKSPKENGKSFNLDIIEDAAQSIGSKYRNKPAGSIGEIGCFSAHPLKNLNALGDSGYVTTNNEIIYKTALVCEVITHC